MSWTTSSAAALTGRVDGPPLPPPAALVPGLTRLRDRFAAHGVMLDPLRGCCERAEIVGLERGGDASCGRMTRLLPARRGWIAVSLSRPDDVASIPAWLERDLTDDPWAVVADEVARRDAADVVARARLLGMPAAVLGEVGASEIGRTQFGTARTHDDIVVIDLSSLWAGPLCSRLLRDAGARVIKVESTTRPDAARASSPEFFARMNDGKEHVNLDFTSERGRAELRVLLAAADVVIEASRPRALEQLGIVAADVVASGARVWVSITGYGRDEPGRDWVAFGDDAAVAGGLVAWDDDGPCFCLDAVADPLTGMTAALAALDALAGNDRVLLDVAMARVAAQYAQPAPATT
jgi:hypothetical protein